MINSSHPTQSPYNSLKTFCLAAQLKLQTLLRDHQPVLGSSAPAAAPAKLNPPVALSEQSLSPQLPGDVSALNGAKLLAAQAAPNEGTPAANSLETIIKAKQITAARELNRSANGAQSQNNNLVKVMLGDDRVALMPTHNGKYSPQEIVDFIKEGELIYEKIQKGEFSNYQVKQSPPVVGEREIAKLMWFLQALAASKASLSATGNNKEAKEFKTGAILISDPSGHLSHFLNLANSYQRASDHFPQYQEYFDPRQHTVVNYYARAVDVFTQDTPYGARSLLYQKLPLHEPIPNANLLYLKFEPYGDRGLSFQETGYSAADIQANHKLRSAPGFFGALKRFFANFKESLACIFSRNPDRRAVNAGDHNLERVPNWLVKENRKFIADLKKRYKTHRDLKTIINELDDDTDELNKTGIYQARLALKKAYRSASLLFDCDFKQDFLEQLKQFNHQLLTRVGDNSNIRFGQEVILTKEDSLSIAPQIPGDPNLEKRTD